MRILFLSHAFNSLTQRLFVELQQRGHAVSVDKAAAIANSDDAIALLRQKRQRREIDQARKPLRDYRAEELARMKLNFYGCDPSYHVARYNFVYKVPKSRTPLTIARHRRSVSASAVRNVS